MDLHARASRVSRSVQRYVTPNSPRPSSRPKMYLSDIRVLGKKSLSTRIGAGELEYGLGLRSRVFFGFVWGSDFEASSGLMQALQLPMAK